MFLLLFREEVIKDLYPSCPYCRRHPVFSSSIVFSITGACLYLRSLGISGPQKGPLAGDGHVYAYNNMVADEGRHSQSEGADKTTTPEARVDPGGPPSCTETSFFSG